MFQWSSIILDNKTLSEYLKSFYYFFSYLGPIISGKCVRPVLCIQQIFSEQIHKSYTIGQLNLFTLNK